MDSIIDVQNKYGSTALYLAVLYEETEMVKLLVQYGADPTILVFGQTALESARNLNNLRRSEALIEIIIILEMYVIDYIL